MFLMIQVLNFYNTPTSSQYFKQLKLYFKQQTMGCCTSHEHRSSQLKEQNQQKHLNQIRSTGTGIAENSIQDIIVRINKIHHTSYQLIRTISETSKEYQIQQKQKEVKWLLKRVSISSNNTQKIRNSMQKYSTLKFPYLLPIIVWQIAGNELITITPLYSYSAANIVSNKRKGESLIEIYKIARSLMYLTSLSIHHIKIDMSNIFYEDQKSICPLIGLPDWGNAKYYEGKSSTQERNFDAFSALAKQIAEKDTSLGKILQQLKETKSLESFTKEFFKINLLEEKRIIPKDSRKVIEYIDGDKYEGEVNEKGQKQGYGIEDGETSYWGQWINNQRNNFGNLKTPNQIYVGEWKDDKYNGKGIFISLQRNQFYQGSFLDGQRDGFGIWENIEGQMYVGQWKNNKKQGEGYYYDPISKFKYQGLWKEDMKNGRGEQYFFQTSISYIGNYQNNLKHDQEGIYLNPNEYKYIGSFIDNSIIGKGKFQYKNKSIYDGQLSNGVYQGKGKYSYNEQYYDGEWKNGCKNGFGIEVKKNQYEYTGRFEDNQRNGEGILHLIAQKMTLKGVFQNGKLRGNGQCTYQNGDSYQGQFEKGMKHGFGVYKHNSGQKYQGQWKEDKYHGKGIYTEQNGGYYEGDFIRGKRQGQGKQYLDTNNWYQGEFKNNKRHGKGVQLQGGDRYEGFLVEGKKHCQKAVMKFNNKDTYQGSFKDNNIEGRGKYVYSDGNQYFGQFKSNKKQGKGTMIFPKQNATYEGEWKDDKREGFGLEIYNKQSHKGRFEGYFKDNKKQGAGIRIYQEAQGTCTMQGTWINNLREGQFIVTFSDGTLEQRQYLNDREINLGVSAMPNFPQ